jgi:hypothetical protein
MKDQASAQATYNRGQAGREVLLAQANSPYIPEIQKTLRDNAKRSTGGILIEKYGLDYVSSSRLQCWWWAWWKNQECNFGHISPIEQKSVDNLMTGFLTQPGMFEWWAENTPNLNADFVAHVDTLIPDAQAMLERFLAEEKTRNNNGGQVEARSVAGG